MNIRKKVIKYIKLTLVFMFILLMSAQTSYEESSLFLILNSVNTVYAEETELVNYLSSYNKYTNKPYGYEIVVPNNLVLNEDIISVKTRFESKDFILEVFYDDFNNTFSNKKSYDDYGNRGIKSNPEFKVTKEYYHKFKSEWGFITIYERRKLEGIENDKNYYVTVSFSRNNKEVVTVLMKSTNPIYIEYMMPDFKFIEKSGEQKKDKIFEPVEKNFDEQTRLFYENYLMKDAKQRFGIFETSYPFYVDKMNSLENMFDYNFPVALTYKSFVHPFDVKPMITAKNMGKVIEYTLYTTDTINGVSKDITLDILEGKYDDYLDKMAQALNELDYPMLLRINNEMNGDWVLYSAYYVGKDTDLYIDCWRYIYNRFKENGVDNLIYVWNPNGGSYPNYAYNSYLNYYPGNEYVDVVGLTAYNTGTYYKGETWKSFSEAYDSFYYDYISRFTHPMMITEFSCASMGGSKSDWFDDMFKKITGYDRIKIAVLWNGQDYDMTKPVLTVSRNYRIDMEEDVIEVIRRGLQSFK